MGAWRKAGMERSGKCLVEGSPQKHSGYEAAGLGQALTPLFCAQCHVRESPPNSAKSHKAILAIVAPIGARYRGNMSTALFAPGVELPVTGKPFGETPARDVDNLRQRMARRARISVVVLSILAAASFGIIWHVGQPFWGNWPHVDATVVSQREYVAKYTNCDLGLSSVIDGRPQRNHVAFGDPCKKAPAIGTVVTMSYSPDDHGWVHLLQCQCAGVFTVGLTGTWLAFPLAGCALWTVLGIRRLRRVTRLGASPWQEVTGVVRSASLKPGGLFLELAVSGAPDVGMRFGTRGIGFFPVPTAGSTFTLRLAGDGSGGVLVALPGHWGESLGLIGPAAARLPAR